MYDMTKRATSTLMLQERRSAGRPFFYIPAIIASDFPFVEFSLSPGQDLVRYRLDEACRDLL